MIGVFQNPWVVGIGGGILSGFVVTLFSRKMFVKKEDREYLQKLVTANHEILYAMRNTISEKQTPSLTIVNSLQSATARKYGIEENDLYSIDEMADTLIKEVMDSRFMPVELKKEYYILLCDLKREHNSVEVRKILRRFDSDRTIRELRYQSRSKSMLSTVIGLLSSVIAICVFMIGEHSDTTLFDTPETLMPVLVAISSGITISILMSIYAGYKNKDNKKDEQTPNHSVNLKPDIDQGND